MLPLENETYLIAETQHFVPESNICCHAQNIQVKLEDEQNVETDMDVIITENLSAWKELAK